MTAYARKLLKQLAPNVRDVEGKLHATTLAWHVGMDLPCPAGGGWHTGTMMAKPLISLVLLALAGLAGCDSGDPPAPLSKQAQATRDAAPEHVFKGMLAGQPVFLLVHDCEVFLVEPLEKGEVHWEKVLAPEPYPFFTSCQRQSIRYEAGVLQVTLGRMAFGAGGCCATGGDYRSTDGRHWKKVS